MLLFFHSYGCRASERVAAEGRIGPALNGELRMGRSGILRQLKAGMIPAVDGSAPCAGLINAMVGRGIAAMDIIQCIAIAALGDADMGFSMAMTSFGSFTTQMTSALLVRQTSQISPSVKLPQILQ